VYAERAAEEKFFSRKLKKGATMATFCDFSTPHGHISSSVESESDSRKGELFMLGSQMLEVAIGLVFVNLLLSAVCSAISEWIAHFTDLRAKTLEEGVRKLLLNVRDGADQELLQKFYRHPFVTALTRPPLPSDRSVAPSAGVRGPSYIPARIFAAVLLDIMAKTAPAAAPAAAPPDMYAILDRLKDGEMREALKALVSDVRYDVTQCRVRIEEWFNQNMEQVSVWYKRRTQKIILVIAAVLVTALNIDALALANALYRDEAVREVVVQQAVARMEKSAPAAGADAGDAALQELRSLNITLGWNWPASPSAVFGTEWAERNLLSEKPLWGWFLKFIGLALSALAAAQGAPFWFDVLGKLVNLRMSGQRPTKPAADEK
jgi:hypothetical protein